MRYDDVKVRCVDRDNASAYGYALTVGKIYQAIRYEVNRNGGNESCTIIDDRGVRSTWNYLKFELVEEKHQEQQQNEEPKKNMKFKYLDINKPSEPKSGDWLYYKPYEFTEASNAIGLAPSYLYSRRSILQATTVGQDRITGYNLDSQSLSYQKNNCILLRFPIDALVSMFHFHNRIITIEPTSESKKCIKTILGVLKPRGNILISQIFIPANQLNFKGLSIYCDNNTIALYHKETLVQFNVQEGTNDDYARKLKLFFGDITLDSKKDYSLCIDKAFTKASLDNSALVKNNETQLMSSIRPVKKYLKDNASRIVGYKKGLALLKKTELPKGLETIIKDVEKQAKNQITEVELQAKNYSALAKSHKDAQNLYSFVKDSAKNPGNDWNLVQNLLKKGVIEKIAYEKGELYWIYSPMTYKHDSSRARDYGIESSDEVFLGRIRVSIKENSSAISFRFISYSSNNVGTLHCLNPANGMGYCLGSFADIIQRLLAGKRVGDLILIMKEYFKSYNQASPYSSGEGGRSWDIMRTDLPDGPAVIDDSWKEYKKKIDSKKAALAA